MKSDAERQIAFVALVLWVVASVISCVQQAFKNFTD
jgi:hypothetical protein